MSRSAIEPVQPRWQPAHDPELISVPGLDTAASLHEQIDQIEQLITIKLQNTDENFSKIHSTLHNKILPAVKHYSVATEPVREAARFWTSFYEEAAQIRIPTEDDLTTVDEQPSDEDKPVAGSSLHDSVEMPGGENNASSNYMTSHTTTTADLTDPSFAHGAITSTPAIARFASAEQTMSTDQDSHSFASTVESPLERLDRNLRDFSIGEPSIVHGSTHRDATFRSHRLDQTIRGPASNQTPLQSAQTRALYTPKDVDTVGALALSPVKQVGAKGVVPKERNPYLPPHTNPKHWNGLVDLSQPLPSRGARERHTASSSPVKEPLDDDDSWDGLPPGMSPPRFMSPARPPRSAAELGLTTLGRTPSHDVANRISASIVNRVERFNQHSKAKNPYQRGMEASSSTLPTPPSLSRYHLNTETSGSSVAFDSTIDSMMRRVQNMVAPKTAPTTPGSKFPVNSTIVSRTESPSLQPEFDPATPVHGRLDNENYDYSDDSELFENEEFNTAHPSAAFLMASQRKPGINDDSLSSEDSLDAEQAELSPGEVHPHPFARLNQAGAGDDSWDDSFEDEIVAHEPSETLFGIKDGQHKPAGPLLRPLQQDTTDLAVAGVASPTPAGPSTLQRNLAELMK